MKLLVLSDSHRNKIGLAKILRKNADADEIIFLGDGADDIEECRFDAPGLMQRDIKMVRGNCDGGSFNPVALTLNLAGHKILCTHGHNQNVKNGLNRLIEEAWEKGCDIALFGHTHEAYFSDDYANLKLFNPGAAAENCYGIITINGSEITFDHMSD